MGNVIEAVSGMEDARLLKPIIYCYPDETVDANAVSLNLLLAKQLQALRPRQRTMRLESCFAIILSTFPDQVVIKDFDVMFNPAYKVDVLKIMVGACKKKPFSMIWPGRYENGKLFYAEDGCMDYQVFNVEDYDVTCII